MLLRATLAISAMRVHRVSILVRRSARARTCRSMSWRMPASNPARRMRCSTSSAAEAATLATSRIQLEIASRRATNHSRSDRKHPKNRLRLPVPRRRRSARPRSIPLRNTPTWPFHFRAQDRHAARRCALSREREALRVSRCARDRSPISSVALQAAKCFGPSDSRIHPHAHLLCG